MLFDGIGYGKIKRKGAYSMNDNLKHDYCVAFLDILGFKYMTGQEKITETFNCLLYTSDAADE